MINPHIQSLTLYISNCTRPAKSEIRAANINVIARGTPPPPPPPLKLISISNTNYDLPTLE